MKSNKNFYFYHTSMIKVPFWDASLDFINSKFNDLFTF